jgi:aryl-alcohol dehydrogenase-like predicted oxidoreductase
LTVSAICLGTVYYGSQIPADEAVGIIRRALDLGITFVDTAEIYMRPNYNAAEEVVGKALAGRRHEVVVATKKRRDPDAFRAGGPADHGLSRQQIVRAIEGSLLRLRTDYVDLYYPHAPDPDVPFDETLRALDDLVRSGKVRYIGLSNYPAWQTVESLWRADRRGASPPVCIQALYNLLDRQIERELLPACRRFALSVVAYSPLAGGVLTGKYGNVDAPVPPESRAAYLGPRATGRPGHVPVLSARNVDAARRLSALAAERGESAASLAIAWVLHQPSVSAAIMGASSTAQLEANVAAADLQLTDAEQEALTSAIS